MIFLMIVLFIFFLLAIFFIIKLYSSFDKEPVSKENYINDINGEDKWKK